MHITAFPCWSYSVVGLVLSLPISNEEAMYLLIHNRRLARHRHMLLIHFYPSISTSLNDATP